MPKLNLTEKQRLIRRREQLRDAQRRKRERNGTVGHQLFWQWGSVGEFQRDVDAACARFWANRKKPNFSWRRKNPCTA